MPTPSTPVTWFTPSFGTTQDIDIPPATAGTMLVIIARSAQDISTLAASGWDFLGGDTEGSLRLRVYTRISDGTENETAAFTNGVNANISTIAYAVTRATHVFAAFTTAASTTTPDPPLLAPGIGERDFLWIAALGISAARSITVFPSGYSGGVENDTTTGGAATLQSTASDENPGAFTISSSANAVVGTLGFVGIAEVTDGPHVYYPEGRTGTAWVLAFTATGPTDTLNWQVWTDPNRSGVMLGSGTCQKDTPTAVRFDGNVPVGQTTTLYLSVDDDV